MAAPPPPSYNATCTNLPLGCMVQTEDDKHLLDFPLAAMSAIKLLDLSMCHRGLNSYAYVAKCGDCGIMSEYDRDSEYVYAKAAGKDWVFSAADRDRVLKDLHSLKFFASDHFFQDIPLQKLQPPTWRRCDTWQCRPAPCVCPEGREGQRHLQQRGSSCADQASGHNFVCL